MPEKKGRIVKSQQDPAVCWNGECDTHSADSRSAERGKTSPRNPKKSSRSPKKNHVENTKQKFQILIF